MGRAQVEIFGLAIIVVLLVLGMIFMLYFVSPKGDDKSLNVYMDDVIAMSLPDAILEVTTDCNNLKFYDLVQDCAILGNFERGAGSINCGGDLTERLSCDYVMDGFAEIFENTLEAWKKEYYFKIYKDDPELPIYTINNPCPGSKMPGFGYVALHPGTLVLQLDICS